MIVRKLDIKHDGTCNNDLKHSSKSISETKIKKWLRESPELNAILLFNTD